MTSQRLEYVEEQEIHQEGRATVRKGSSGSPGRLFFPPICFLIAASGSRAYVWFRMVLGCLGPDLSDP